MTREMPPLNRLRAFEAAARSESFTKAAEELNVSAGAISRHIQSLEEELGFPLFVREHRMVRLTEPARVYWRQIGSAFSQITKATNELKTSSAAQTLRLYSYPTFALHWMMPVLKQFRARNPAISVELRTWATPVDLDQVRADGAVILGAGNWQSMKSVKLTDFDCTLFCSPKMRGVERLIGRPDLLSEYPILSTSTRPRDWENLLKEWNISITPAVQLSFDNHSLAMEAAVQGMGVVAGIKALARGYYSDGRLIQPFPFVRRARRSAYLVYPEERECAPGLASFLEFLAVERPLQDGGDPAARLQ